MSHATTIPRILKVVGIEPRQVDLIDKVLEMESDKKRVHSIELHHGTLPNFNLWAEVYMKENFKDISEFLKYIRENEIFEGAVYESRDNRTYLLNSRGVRVEFKKFANYLQK